MKKPKIAFKTLGCRLNQYETDALVSAFVNAGYELVDYHEQADAYVINTCTITNSGDKKSRQELTRTLRRHPDAVIVATGCMATHYKEQLTASKNYTYVVDNDHKTGIFDLLDGHFAGEIMDPGKLKADRFSYTAANHGFHTRSMIKIQDGCDNFCSYCIVPFVRGRAVSRKPQDILQNIRQVLDFGFKEIVITGVNIGRYRYEDTDFEDLIEKILEVEGDFRVRISSIEPEGYGERLFKMFKHPKLAPHIHLCLQSGSDRILKAMNRNYNRDKFTAMVNKLREIVPDINLTTDIIVGFPTEDEKAFEESVQAAKELAFSHIHTFKYSNRSGTRASKMKEQVHGTEMNRRSEEIRIISEQNKRKYRSSFTGKKERVLVEKIENGYASGYGEHYFPIRFPATAKTQVNEFYEVLITDIEAGDDPMMIGKA